VTAACALVALFIALVAQRSVFELVVLSWSALASALGPLVILQACRRPLTTPLAAAVLIGGLSAALVWRYGLQLSASLYEVMPGMASGFIIYFLGSFLLRPANVDQSEAPA
jgi:sodium/proline symporter